MMPKIDKKKRLIILIAFLLYSSSFLILPTLLYTYGMLAGFVSEKLFTILMVICTILSLYGLVMPWLIQKDFFPWLFQRDSKFVLLSMNPQYKPLLYCYLFLLTPSIYGLALLVSGMPIAGYYYFVIATIIGSLLWGLYNVITM